MSPFELELMSIRPQLMRNAMKLCGGDRTAAEDLLSDTIERALRYQERFEMGTKLVAWASFIMRNHFISQIRRAKWDGGSVDDLTPAKLPAMSAPQGTVIDLADTIRALNELPRDQREAVMLIGAGASYEEAADELCISVGTVKSRVARGRDALRELLA